MLPFSFVSYKSRVGSGTRTKTGNVTTVLGVDMNAEPFFIVSDKVVHKVKNKAMKDRRDHLVR